MKEQTIFFILLLLIIPPLQSLPLPLNGTCSDMCGTIPIKFPFGSGTGCGHPDFSRYVNCTPGGTLRLSGAFDIAAIDYATNTLVVDDPLMSTCASMQNSGGFNLDRAGPFTVAAGNIFALVGCSTTSPVFDRDSDLCDRGSGLNVCRGLYACAGVRGIGLEPHAPVSTCCVYEAPVSDGSGLSLGLDLPKLQCSSYAAVYGFGGREGDPMRWQYGIVLRYSYNESSYYSSECKNCEESGGFCGFEGSQDSFACRCRNGFTTAVNCYGRGNLGSAAQSHIIQTALTVRGFLLMWMIAFF